MSLTVRERYSGPAIVLHWLIAALIVGNLIGGLSFDYLPKSIFRPVLDAHKSFGLTILGLAIMRLLWRFVRQPPPMPAGYKPWEKKASHAMHWALYVMIFLVPLSGWAHDSAWKEAATHPIKLFWLIPFPRIGFIESMAPASKESFHTLTASVHQSLAYLIGAMVLVHLAGALKHQFIDKEPELQRMGIGRF